MAADGRCTIQTCRCHSGPPDLKISSIHVGGKDYRTDRVWQWEMGPEALRREQGRAPGACFGSDEMGLINAFPPLRFLGVVIAVMLFEIWLSRADRSV